MEQLEGQFAAAKIRIARLASLQLYYVLSLFINRMMNLVNKKEDVKAAFINKTIFLINLSLL
jgi:hypothetical protein